MITIEPLDNGWIVGYPPRSSRVGPDRRYFADFSEVIVFVVETSAPWVLDAVAVAVAVAAANKLRGDPFYKMTEDSR